LRISATVLVTATVLGAFAGSATAAPLPDLRTTDLSAIPHAAAPNTQLNVRYAVKNVGDALARASKSGFYLSTDRTFDDTDLFIGRDGVKQLVPGQTARGRATLTLPPTTPDGAFVLIAVADYLGRVPESHENNNALAGPTITVAAATVGTLAGASVTPASTVAGATGNVDVSFTTAHDWPSTGKLDVVFPSGFDVSGASFVGASGVDGTFTAAAAGQTVTLTRSGGTTAAGGSTPSITLGGITNPLGSGTTSPYALSTRTPEGAVIDQGTAPGTTISPGTLTGASVIPATTVAGATGNVDVSFTTANQWPATGRLAIVFPSGFDVSGASFVGASGVNGTFGASSSGQTVTLIRSGGTTAGAGSSPSITIGGITNPPVSGTTGLSTLSTRTPEGAVIDQGTAPGTTIDPGTLTGAAVTPSSTVAGATGNVDVGFTSANAWPANGKLAVTFPAGFDVSSASFVTATGVDGTMGASVAGQTVTLTRSGGTTTGPGTLVSVTLGGVTNPPVSGTTGTYDLSTTTSTGTTIDHGTAPGTTLSPGALSSASVTPDTTVSGATGNVVIGFTMTNAWPSTGKLVVVFPPGFDVSSASFVTASGVDGTMGVSVSGLTLTLTRSGGTATGPGATVSITVGGITNPPGPGTTAAYDLTTTTATGAAIDHGTAPGTTFS